MSPRTVALTVLLTTAYVAFILVLTPLEAWLKLTIGAGVVGAEVALMVLVALGKTATRASNRRRIRRRGE